MTGPEIMAGVGFFVMLLGTVSGIWWRIEGKVGSARDKADKVAEDLAAHRLHVAEVYISKAGIREWRDEILGAMAGLKDDLRHLSNRIDGMK